MNVDADLAVISHLVDGDDQPLPRVEVTGPPSMAASAFDVDRALAASAAYAVAAADRVGGLRGGPVPTRSIDLEHLLAFCTTHVEVDGEAVPAWADLSGVYETTDGRHLQIHCNFDHHATGVVQRLGCASTRESVAAAIGERNAFELEAALIADGMIAAVVRTLDEWADHPHARATADLPLVSVEQIADAPPRALATGSDADAPLRGVRVVDCSRVLAGPVAGQMLAGAGADVIRIGAEHLPSVPIGVMATGFGKRNAYADIETDAGRTALWELLSESDVWIDAYRPGALASHGFTPERVAAARPGIVIVQVCAFDWVGPWAGRRGFDSIIQSTTGVRAAGGEWAVGDDGEPAGVGPIGLPVQALDYATGFLAAGVASQLVARRAASGGSWLARLSLLRTRDWLLSMGGPTAFRPSPVAVDDRFLDEIDSDFGRIRSVRPFVGAWPGPPTRLGSSSPTW
ncbi:CoA transferase [Ilumatobacter coccineus]|uniref:CaiB/BaiF family protein n=1 Tax=Ilumatobacter coccineus (strain NBRC 103263 / KCTC 29153 / YM16-304) TaxID=1313172 RepID=A0A6C7E075_ILUCY|nr:CoA transferase [Ilumatobacter coccineus]BAN00431.1 CaiB/BaiF family protein [Ilumatobacter coccineus YM16-304]